ncbi:MULTISPECIES: hypothetical protein [Rhodococcus]|uniref:Site-specific recombinase n=1 Tax=Rhodococcus opacus RKJ300 = JCM 13270 TaxID=1165867 RepID=I0W5Z4_RHOOP|nr:MULTISPECIES: hypothetical protein [Rhodococcus]EID71810.1 site-specific recombinase [Rhodococcus opacus RKJ300 = JCM 13270]QQZ14837.1 hypothetical protein GO592_01035 [Rhodococcus sp. 21391]
MSGDPFPAGTPRCGDGPLVTGTDSGIDEIPASVRDWLAQRDWVVDSDLLCPNHS